MSPAADRLSHDHRELNELLIALHEALGRVERDPERLPDELHEIRDAIEAFREALLEHFAREQENLLPFVTNALPWMSERCDSLVIDHDRIAGLVSELVIDLAGAETRGTMATWTSQLAVVEAAYSTHSRVELGFFDEVRTALSADARAAVRLRALLDEA